MTVLARSPGARLVGALLVAGLVALATSVGTRAGARTAEHGELSEAREELERIRDELPEAEQAAQQAEEELTTASETLARVEAVVNDVAAAVERQNVAVEHAEQRLREMAAARDELSAAFQRRAAQMYKLGPTRSLDLVLTGDSAAQAMARDAYLRVVVAGDQVDLEQLAAAADAVAAERERAEAERRQLDEMLEEQEQVMAEAQELRESRALAAAAAQDRVALLEEQQDDLESEEERLEELIERRQRQRRSVATNSAGGGGTAGAAVSAPSRSGYAWPMCAPVTSEYGPRWGRMHRGIDLGAPSGRPVGAAKAGTVIFAGWQGGYGRLVLIDHGDGVVTAYAHLRAISVGNGQRVARGQQIGRVGSSGNSTGPHLHLEFRVNGRAVNGRQYLSGGPC